MLAFTKAVFKSTEFAKSSIMRVAGIVVPSYNSGTRASDCLIIDRLRAWRAVASGYCGRRRVSMHRTRSVSKGWAVVLLYWSWQALTYARGSIDRHLTIKREEVGKMLDDDCALTSCEGPFQLPTEDKVTRPTRQVCQRVDLEL